MKAMIFAAGLGTRLKPLTDTMPKALVPVGGKPLLQIQLERLKAAGVTDVVINVHHFASQIVRFVAEHDSFGMNIMFSPELDELLETGGGVRRAAPMFMPASAAKTDYVLLHNVDILSNLNIASWTKLGRQALANADDQLPEQLPAAFLLVSDRPTSRYLLFDRGDRLVGWTNVRTGEVRSPYPNLDVSKCRALAFSGIHLLSTAAMRHMQTWPSRFSIIDFYLDICATWPVYGSVVPGLQLMDVGKLDTLDQAEAFIHTLHQ